MRVLTVAPLVRGIPYEELTYFAKDDVSAGDLVEVTIKKRVCRALVLTAVDAEEERQSLRHASFVMKKITKVVTKHFIPEELWNALFYASTYLIRPVGSLIYDLLSEKAYDEIVPFVNQEVSQGFDLLLLEQNYENRVMRYKTTIREMFSKKKSLVIFFPTITDLDHAKELLSKGIDDYVVTFHSALTEKQYSQAIKQCKDDPHPLLILSTPSIVPWLRKDLGLVIVEREHSHYYYTHGDSGYDMRIAIESLARFSNVPLLLGSHMLSLRAHMFYKTKDAHEVMPLQFRNDTGITVIPMQETENRSMSPYLSRQALHILHSAKQLGKGHYFLYAHRKGMYPTTVCSDCGSLFTCPDCHRPYVLHKIAGVRTYVCHGCENIVHLTDDTTLACRSCGGWRMTLLGIATGGIEEELSKLGIPLFAIDGERTPTRAKVKKVYKEWKESPYGVLIGTEMAHNIVDECNGIIILSLDPLFSLPEYRTDEKILNLVTEMAEKISQHGPTVEKKLFLQTRLKNTPVIKQLSSPSFREVYSSLLKEREEFLLPPYYVVIKASFDNLADDMRKRIGEELEPYVVEWFEQGKGVTLLFVHIKETEWANNKELKERVKRVVSEGRPLVNPLHFFI